MTLLDAVVIILLLLFLIRGVWIGFIRQLASIAALFLGYIAAGQYYKQFSAYLAPYIETPQIAFLITYAALFLLTFLAVVLLGYLLKQVMTLSLLGWFDRFLGSLFGLAKAMIICTIGFMLLSGMLSASNPLIKNSLLAPYLSESASFFLNFIKDKDLHSTFLPKEPAIVDLLPEAVPGGKSPGGDAKKKP